MNQKCEHLEPYASGFQNLAQATGMTEDDPKSALFMMG